jgi:hypothetical protein
MESDDLQKKDFDFEVPVVSSRREFFDQEAIFIDDPDEAEPSYAEPEDPVEDLKKMREQAAKRTRREEG